MRIHTSIVIDAPPDEVWRVLTDFDAYPTWNPFIVSLAGDLALRGRLVARIAPPGRRPMTFKPRVVALSPGTELRWLGHLVVPGLFDGEHRFVVEPMGGGKTRFVQSEEFSGLLVPLFRGMLDDTRRGFEAMNQALCRRAEQATRPSIP